MNLKFASLDNIIVDLFEGETASVAKPLARSSVKVNQDYSSKEKVVVLLVVPGQATNKV